VCWYLVAKVPRISNWRSLCLAAWKATFAARDTQRGPSCAYGVLKRESSVKRTKERHQLICSNGGEERKKKPESVGRLVANMNFPQNPLPVSLATEKLRPPYELASKNVARWLVIGPEAPIELSTH